MRLTLAPDLNIDQWSIDTRTMLPRSLYIALKGENHDGHRFLADAAAKGALAALVSDGDWPEPLGLRLIRVADTLLALQQLGRQARARMRFPIIGITGSAGKTATKDTCAKLLGARLHVNKNEGNLNNHIGVPLSLLRFAEDAGAGVVEMGMNHAGEIALLAEIARPEIGVVTNVGTAHIENFSSEDSIALAKRELIEALPVSGSAVLNADDARVAAFAVVHPGRSVTFGMDQEADFRATDVAIDADGARFRVNGQRFTTSLPGRHGVLNVTAGVAIGSILGLTLPEMADAARELRAGKMRGERLEYRGMTILNDCYNSNPEAAQAMLDTLAALPGNRKVAVLGEMLEMGEWAERLHRQVGRHAAEAGIDVVIGIAGAAVHLVDEAKSRTEAYFFADSETAGLALRELARQGDVLLFKGSRGTRVEKALERFMAS